MTTRLSAISLAGTARTLVAVGTVSDVFMLATTRAAAPRSGLAASPTTAGAALGRGSGLGAAGAGRGSFATVATCPSRPDSVGATRAVAGSGALGTASDFVSVVAGRTARPSWAWAASAGR